MFVTDLGVQESDLLNFKLLVFDCLYRSLVQVSHVAYLGMVGGAL